MISEVGDIIFAKQGFTKLLGYGVVEGEYEFDEKQDALQARPQSEVASEGRMGDAGNQQDGDEDPYGHHVV